MCVYIYIYIYRIIGLHVLRVAYSFSVCSIICFSWGVKVYYIPMLSVNICFPLCILIVHVCSYWSLLGSEGVLVVHGLQVVRDLLGSLGPIVYMYN